MLSSKMSLKDMINFKPNDEDMAVLDLDVVVYMKVSMVSIDKRINYNFIRFLLNDEDDETNQRGKEVMNCLKDIDKSVFYDFEFKKDDDTRAITITEFYSKENYTATEMLFRGILEEYSHDAEIIIDFYTHDNHEYRLSNLDGVVVNNQLK